MLRSLVPVYEYRCNDCRTTFEVLRRMGERELSTLCPSCESRASMPLISQVAVTRGAAGASAAGGAPVPASGGCCGGVAAAADASAGHGGLTQLPAQLAVTAAEVHQRLAVGRGGRDDAADDDRVVAMLGDRLHLAVEPRQRADDQRRAGERRGGRRLRRRPSGDGGRRVEARLADVLLGTSDNTLSPTRPLSRTSPRS